MGDLHGGGHPVPLLGLPVLTQGDEHAGVPVALVGVVVVGEKDLFELALVGEKRLGGKEELTTKGRERMIWGDGPASCRDCTCLSKLRVTSAPKTTKLTISKL